jgi:hypothetical protein
MTRACGFTLDCVANYAATALNDSIAAWDADMCNADIQLGMKLASEAAAAACRDGATRHWGRNKTYCLPPEAERDRTCKWVSLPKHQSYLLPQDPQFRHAFHFEADGRVLALLEELLSNEVPGDRTLNDFGAGVGQYGHTLLSRQGSAGITVRSWDGAGNVASFSDGFVNHFDLAYPSLALPRAFDRILTNTRPSNQA